METPRVSDTSRADTATLGKSVVIKGDVTGSEDLYVDGQLEGSITLEGSRLTIGPNGRIKANIVARGVTIAGKLEGDVRAGDRVDLRQTAVVLGDIATQRIAIEDGAYFKGGVDIQREPAKSPSEAKPAAAPAAAATGSSTVGTRG